MNTILLSTIARFGQHSWHMVVSTPLDRRWTHISHLSATPASASIARASYGQADTHDAQPMQISLSTTTTPSSRFDVAPTGHTSMQLGVSQCWHGTGRHMNSSFGYDPVGVSSTVVPSAFSTRILCRSSATLFSILQLMVQVRHPTQRCRLIAKAYVVIPRTSYAFSISTRLSYGAKFVSKIASCTGLSSI